MRYLESTYLSFCLLIYLISIATSTHPLFCLSTYLLPVLSPTYECKTAQHHFFLCRFLFLHIYLLHRYPLPPILCSISLTSSWSKNLSLYMLDTLYNTPCFISFWDRPSIHTLIKQQLYQITTKTQNQHRVEESAISTGTVGSPTVKKQIRFLRQRFLLSQDC